MYCTAYFYKLATEYRVLCGSNFMPFYRFRTFYMQVVQILILCLLHPSYIGASDFYGAINYICCNFTVLFIDTGSRVISIMVL